MIFIFAYTKEPNFNKDMILRNMGYKNDTNIPDKVLNKLRESIEELENIIMPTIIWDRFPFVLNEEEEKIEFRNNSSIYDKRIVANFKKAEEIVIAIGSLGDVMDKKANYYITKKDYLKVFVFDAISEAVMDGIKKDFEYELGRICKEKGMGRTHGFYPGSNGWKLEDQKVLFSLFDKEAIGVNLNENFIMIPTKSFSAIYGVGEVINTRVIENKCMYCNLTSCRFRNTSIEDNYLCTSK